MRISEYKEHKGNHEGRFVLRVLLFLLLIVSFSPYPLTAQISEGGEPLSFGHQLKDDVPVVSLDSPDLAVIRAADVELEKQALPPRVAVSVSAGIDLVENGQWITMSDGSRIGRIAISSPGALALGAYFSDFKLQEGCRFFVYNKDHSFLIGAYTLYNNSETGLFATELIPGDHLIFEIDLEPLVSTNPSLVLSEISYAYRDIPGFILDRGTSDPCEVNINCPEGDNWQKQKRGVVRIYIKESGGFFWCSGSLVNNALQDFEPFLLTADHCAPDVTPDDISQWIFYFNYEGPGCDNPQNGPTDNTMTGAVKLASATTNGSDFLLIRLNQEVPQNYQPFFNGWNNENVSSPSGVSIHHPAGDIKKISTYTQPLTSSQWGASPNTHWQVIWSPTTNGWGVTEGGSSGAPLFDNNGRIIGSLTGGMASCEPGSGGPGTGPDQPDYYGKFSYSWDQNGTEPEQQLKFWLDPENSGITTLSGLSSNLSAGFSANETIILAGGDVIFTNESSGLPDSYIWTFEGGTPSSYIGKNPPEVTYPSEGYFDVSLVVSDGISSDTLMLKDYIQVVGKVYPNPATNHVTIYIDTELPSSVEVEVFNILGQRVYQTEIPDQTTRIIEIDVSNLAAGIYNIRLTAQQRYVFGKFMKIQPE